MTSEMCRDESLSITTSDLALAWRADRGRGRDEDVLLEDDQSLYDARLMRVIHQRRQRHRGSGGFGSHQGRAEHDA